MTSENQCSDCNFDIVGSQTKAHGPPDTLYQHYLRNNGYPQAIQVNSLVDGMEAAKAQSNLVRVSIGRLKAALASLEEEDLRITDIIARYRTILRAAHKLPPEILAKIFLFTLDPPVALDSAVPRAYPPHSLDTSKAPWSLAQVCRTWRKVSHGIPNLWSSVYCRFRGGDGATPSSQSYAHRLRLQLQRSASHPLTVVLSSPHNTDINVADPMVTLLSSHTDHIKHLRFDLNKDNLPFTSFSSGLFRQLETLDIRILTPPPPLAASAIPTSLDTFACASRLKRLILWGDLNGFTLKLPYLQITSFHWCQNENPIDVSLGPLYRVLSLLPNLQTCRLSFNPRTISSFSPATGFFGGTPKLTLHSLHELELACTTQQRPSSNKGILTWLTASRLTHLTTFSSGYNTATLSALFPDPRKIVFLVIQQVEMSASEFEDALSKLTSLQTLEFGVLAGITNIFISSFQRTLPRSETFYIAPKLRRLALLAIPSSKSSYSDEKAVDMLEARRRETSDASGNSQLASFVLDREMSDLSACERLDVLINNGLEVSGPRKLKT